LDIPSDLTGLLLFAVLLLPGFAYNSVRARRRPIRQLTSLQETVIIVLASLVALLVTGIVFAVIRALLPGVTPDIRALLFSTRHYLRAHYVRTAWWVIAFMAAAIGGAIAVAGIQSSERVGRGRYLRWLGAPPDPSTQSGWWIAFTSGPPEPHRVHVGCTLDDGSYVSGWLKSFSQVAEDTADRDLVLRAPISVRPLGAATAQEVPRVQLMTISARHIVTTSVAYVRKPPPPQPALFPVPAAAAPQAPRAPAPNGP
jgi:hypothetical protein